MGERLGPKLMAEFLGSLFLVYVIISSAILAYDILGADLGTSVIYIGLATGFWLFVLVAMFGPVSGAHFNPAVTIALLATKDIDGKTAAAYIPVQIIGGLVGTLFAHLTFYHTIPVIWTVSEVARPGGCYFSEFLGTFMLLATIYGCVRSKVPGWFIALAVGLVVGGGIITTSATMFVNPMVTIARVFTYAIAGIRPFDVGPFIVAQIVGALAAAGVFSYLYPKES